MARFFTSRDISEFFKELGYDWRHYSIQFYESGDDYIVNVLEIHENETRTYLFCDFEIQEEGEGQVFTRHEVYMKRWIRYLSSLNGQRYKTAFLNNAAKEAVKEAMRFFEEE